MAHVGALKMRVVKPSKLKTKEMKQCLRNGLRRVGEGMKRDFERTTKTWDLSDTKYGDVEFKVATHVAGDDQEIVVEVSTDNQIYAWVNNGTRQNHPNGYPITAGFWTGKSDKKALAFFPGGMPKTTPGNLDAGLGAAGTGKAVVRRTVTHPGIEARNYDKQIEQEWQGKFRHEMEIAMQEAVAASGHGR